MELKIRLSMFGIPQALLAWLKEKEHVIGPGLAVDLMLAVALVRNQIAVMTPKNTQLFVVINPIKIFALIKTYPNFWKLSYGSFLFFFIIQSIACNLIKPQREQQAVLLEKEIFILEDSSYNLLQHAKLYTSGEDTFLTAVVHHKEIVFWNLSTLKKEKFIDLKLAERQNIFNFYIEDNNRILVAMNPIFRNHGHESSILHLDTNKRILDSFSFGNLPVFRTYDESLKGLLY